MHTSVDAYCNLTFAMQYIASGTIEVMEYCHTVCALWMPELIFLCRISWAAASHEKSM